MRLGVFAIILYIIIGVSGCFLSSTPNLNWSQNIAIMAASSDPKINDDNIYTEGDTTTILEDVKSKESQMESDNFTEALLSWNVPQQIQHIVIKAREGQLEFFEIQYMDDNEKWITIKEVRENMRPIYKYTTSKPIVTSKFRLKVPRRWDSRRIGGPSRSKRSETGAPTAAEFRKIQEIQLYYALPTPAPDAPPMQ